MFENSRSGPGMRLRGCRAAFLRSPRDRIRDALQRPGLRISARLCGLIRVLTPLCADPPRRLQVSFGYKGKGDPDCRLAELTCNFLRIRRKVTPLPGKQDGILKHILRNKLSLNQTLLVHHPSRERGLKHRQADRV